MPYKFSVIKEAWTRGIRETDLADGVYRGRLRGFTDTVFIKSGIYLVFFEPACNKIVMEADYNCWVDASPVTITITVSPTKG